MRANPYHNIPVLTWCYCAWPGGKIWGGGAAKGGFGWSCRCPWVLPGLTCSYTPSYLPVGGSWSQWTPTQCWCRWQWWWWRCPDMDQGGLNLISVPSKKAAGGKKAIFIQVFVSRLCAKSGWQMSPPFLHLIWAAKEEERCLHSVLTVWLSVWEKGRWLACSTSLPLYPDTHPTQLLPYTLLCNPTPLTQARHTIRATSITSV